MSAYKKREERGRDDVSRPLNPGDRVAVRISFRNTVLSYIPGKHIIEEPITAFQPPSSGLLTSQGKKGMKKRKIIRNAHNRTPREHNFIDNKRYLTPPPLDKTSRRKKKHHEMMASGVVGPQGTPSTLKTAPSYAGSPSELTRSFGAHISKI